MQKKFFKRIVATGMAILMSGCLVTVKPESAFAAAKIENAPMYIAITQTYVNLTISSSGKANCEASTKVLKDHSADVYVELQQYDGGWTTIKDWSDSDSLYAVVDEDWYVEKGYKYRVKATHRSYNSSGTQLEKTTTYSKTVTY